MIPTARLWYERCFIIPKGSSYMGLSVKFSCVHDIAEYSHCSTSDLNKLLSTQEWANKPYQEDINSIISIISIHNFRMTLHSAGTYLPVHYWNSVIWIEEVQMSWKAKQIFSIALHFLLPNYNDWLIRNRWIITPNCNKSSALKSKHQWSGISSVIF